MKEKMGEENANVVALLNNLGSMLNSAVSNYCHDLGGDLMRTCPGKA